jgi:hypothetical protein
MVTTHDVDWGTYRIAYCRLTLPYDSDLRCERMPSLEQRKRPSSCGTGFNVRLWCNTDPCGLVCAVISWFLVLYAECTVVVGRP